MDEPAYIRRLAAADLRAYKALRDEMLAAYSEAFTSDAATERQRCAEDYLPRLGIQAPESGRFTLGAWQGADLLGAIALERDGRPKVRHIGQVVGMMVRSRAQGHGVGRSLLDGLTAQARANPGLELLTLTVTAGNEPALRLYRSTGFETYGRLESAIRIGDRSYAKIHMVKTL